ncbi:MAG: hypothetical protein H9855_00930 [Candidatus Acinetobacter avistercoris]|uniref:hypothetical protein n=1 Tax=Acinetobacter sp. KS-LM10 TaxID=3120518 RepID=UPI001FA1C379|nr:hypothetical protein [Candidatus Acinetobacter avistercoris]
MTIQKKVSDCVLIDLVASLLKQNNQLLKNLNTLSSQNNQVISQNSQLIQITNEQNAQINELLEHLDLDGGDESKSGYLDG